MGIKVGMGVDGEGSSDLPDPFENMRMGLYVIRARYESAKILQPIDVLRFHTMSSAEVLGVADKVGSLEVGKFGDVIIVDPRLVERGPIVDPYAAVVLACNAMTLARGHVREWEVFKRAKKGFSSEYAFASIWIKSGNTAPVTRVLEARILPPFEGQDGLGADNSPGLSRIATAEFTAQYPLAHLRFKDT